MGLLSFRLSKSYLSECGSIASSKAFGMLVPLFGVSSPVNFFVPGNPLSLFRMPPLCSSSLVWPDLGGQLEHSRDGHYVTFFRPRRPLQLFSRVVKNSSLFRLLPKGGIL